jgi:ribosomal protein S18 acetylase RimI-like enzyme
LGYTFRALTTADINQIMDLQYAYNKVYPKAVVIPGEIYLSPFLNGGKNMICAFDDEGKMKGYTGVNIYLATQPGIAHTLWSIIKVDPAVKNKVSLQDMLYQKSIEKARELIAPHSGYAAQLKFQHHDSEGDIIQFLKSKGCTYMESAFNMVCDLSNGPLSFPVPDGILVRDLDKSNTAEQQDYLNAKNDSFPLRVSTLKEWQFFFREQMGEKGKVIIAYKNKLIVGGVSVYTDDELNKRLGMEIGQVEDVFVSEPYRHRDIAACLISLGLKYFKQIGMAFSHLEVRATNHNALRLYEKMGYKAVDETQFYVLKL